MKKTLFVKNAAVLTFSALALRFAGIVFKVWLASAIGADGIGLYQLVFSLYALSGALSQSGLPVAVTRLIAESGDDFGKAKSIMAKAFAVNLAVGLAASLVMFFGADFFAGTLAGDPRAALSIKVLAFSVVFMGASALIRGYFIARRNANPSAVSQILEQLLRIGVALLAVRLTRGFALHITCAAVFAGDTVAEILALIYLLARYRLDRTVKNIPAVRAPHAFGRMVSVSLPITAGRYLASLLRTAENFTVPRALAVFSKNGALALFGMIKGMALPVLLFPSVLLGAVSTLLVPEMSEAAKRRRTLTVRFAAEDVLRAASAGGFIFSAVFAAAGYRLGALLYKSADVGFLITALAPIVPLMYLDSLCDGLLKGLGQQNFTFGISVADSAARLALIYPVVSRFGVKGFIAIMYFSNLFTAVMNLKRLIKISGAVINTQKAVVIPLLAAYLPTLLAKLLLDLFVLPDLVNIILICLISIPIYVFSLYRCDCINFHTFGRTRTQKKYANKTTAASLTR